MKRIKAYLKASFISGVIKGELAVSTEYRSGNIIYGKDEWGFYASFNSLYWELPEQIIPESVLYHTIDEIIFYGFRKIGRYQLLTAYAELDYVRNDYLPDHEIQQMVARSTNLADLRELYYLIRGDMIEPFESWETENIRSIPAIIIPTTASLPLPYRGSVS